jgi:hypothetical protein
MRKSIAKLGSLVCAAALLSGCMFFAKPQARVPTEIFPATVPGPAKRLVIVLPGQGDDIAKLKEFGIAKAIQRSLPDAEVALVELTMTYYMEGRATERLHEEVIQPAKQRGIREIYLAGASMGGMGALMYERDFPNQLTGLVLMAPYMGGGSLIKEIKAAGLPNWQAGPVPAQLSRSTVPREEWRLAQSWLTARERPKSVWLICGQRDQFHEAAQMLSQVLPADHYLAPDGGHAWKVWVPAAEEVFARIAAKH